MTEPGSEAGFTRRQALKRGVVAAGTAVWVAPAVQALTMSAASAASPSGADASARGGSRRATTRGKGTGVVQSGGRANEHAGG